MKLLGHLVIFGILTLQLFANQQTGKWGDQGDGTYRNPIIAADYSDPDVIRVGTDYYLVTSTFQMSPGVTILHSKDLVNWETIGAAIPDVSVLGPDLNWNEMSRYNEGVYAPSLRYHNGKFWVFVNCHSGEGFFCCTATNATGPWTVTQIKDKNGKPLRTRGWTDPCPFWDDDGKAYLASSHPGSHWFAYLFQMKPDGSQLLDADVDKMNANNGSYTWPDSGTLFSPFYSSEGNKIFKHDGYYYLQHIEFLDRGQGKGTYIFRSRNIYGTNADGMAGLPGDSGKYDVLKFGNDIPGQGGFVDTPDGHWFWIGQFNRYGSDGRPPNLLPVTWVDGWPVPGVDITNKVGKFTWQLPKPIIGEPVEFPQGSDNFDSATLRPQWQWNYQPRADKWSLTDRLGWLRLYAFPQRQNGNFFKIGNIICQRHFRSESSTVTIKIDVSAITNGQEAGLAHFNGGKNYTTLGIVQVNGVRHIKYEDDSEKKLGEILPNQAKLLWLRSSAGFDDFNAFSFSFDGRTFTSFGNKYELKCAGYRGDLVGIYTFNKETEAGFVDVDFFQYDFNNK